MGSTSMFVCCIIWSDYRLVSEWYVCTSPKQALRICIIRAIVCIALFDQRVDCRAAATQPLLRDAHRPTRTQPNKCVLPVSSAILPSTRGEFLLLTPSITPICFGPASPSPAYRGARHAASSVSGPGPLLHSCQFRRAAVSDK